MEDNFLREEDYKEPACPMCTDFYNPDEKSVTPVPVMRIMEKVDALFEVNDSEGALRVLKYWIEEAKAGNDDRGRLSLLNELMGLYRKMGRHEEAMKTADEAMHFIERADVADSKTAGTVYLNGATVMKAAGKAENSIPYYKKAEELYRKYLPENAKEFAGLYNNMALAYADIGKKETAEILLNRAIKIMLAAENGELDAAISYVNLAHLHEDDEGFVSNCLDRARELLDKETVKRDGYYAFVCDKCAPSFDYFGYFLDAKKYKDLSKQIYERNRNC